MKGLPEWNPFPDLRYRKAFPRRSKVTQCVQMEARIQTMLAVLAGGEGQGLSVVDIV